MNAAFMGTVTTGATLTWTRTGIIAVNPGTFVARIPTATNGAIPAKQKNRITNIAAIRCCLKAHIKING